MAGVGMLAPITFSPVTGNNWKCLSLEGKCNSLQEAAAWLKASLQSPQMTSQALPTFLSAGKGPELHHAIIRGLVRM